MIGSKFGTFLRFAIICFRCLQNNIPTAATNVVFLPFDGLTQVRGDR